MMKQITVLLLTFTCFSAAFAQNIGIGTAIPNAKLEIVSVGNTNASSALFVKNNQQNPLLYVRSDGKTGLGISNVDAHYPWAKFVVASQYGAESDFVLRVADSVNFSSTPWFVFQASDGTLSAPTLISNQGLGSVVGQGFDGAAYQTGASINFGLDGTPAANDMPGVITFNTTQDGTVNHFERMRINNAGNVGIGTTTPAYRLTVASGLSFGYGNGTAAYSSRTETRVNAGLQGNAGAQSGFFETSAPSPAANWPVGASSWWHLLDVRHSNDANIYAMQMSGSFFDQNFYVRKTNGAANTPWSQMMTSGNIGTNAILNQNAAAQTANYWISGNGFIGGSVGIGTSTPLGKLHIVHNSLPNVNIEGSSNVGTWLAIGNTSTGGQWFDIISTASGNGEGAGKLIFTRSAAANSTAGTIMTFEHATSRVGVGTTAPRGIFDVAPNSDIYLVNNTTAGTTQSVYLPGHIYLSPYNGSNISYLQARRSNTSGTTALRFRTCNAGTLTEAVHIEGNGRVGIGTTAPACGLHIAMPEVGVTGTGVFCSGGSTGNAAIELRGGANPHIDFANDGAVDYDARFILGNNNELQLQGAQLYVTGWQNQNFGNTGTFIENFLGTGDLSWANGTFSYAIRADNGLGTIGEWFACYSDQRIKKDVHPLDDAQALQTLRQIEINQYKYIDRVKNGTKERTGVIAQQVETVFPEAISKLQNFIPNVYELARDFQYNEGNQTLTVTSPKPCECKEGDRMRLYVDEENIPKELKVLSVSGNAFVLAGWESAPPKQVFVYGKEVADFRGVDYDRIFMLGMSAIQELDKKVTELEQMKQEMQQMKRDLEEMKKR